MINANLTILPTVHVWRDQDLLLFDRKFYDGVLMFLKNWEGNIHCVMRRSNAAPPEFGLIRKRNDEIPFTLTILHHDQDITINHIKNSSIVVAAGGSSKQLHLSSLCQINGIMCVYLVENLLEMRYQVIDLLSINFARKIYRKLRAWKDERKRLVAFRLANGIQANGVAAFERYRKLNNCILYFDTRVNKALIIGDEELERRLEKLSRNQPLKLAFSGRLIKIKGVDHLIPICNLMRERNISFEMSIFGAGELEDSMLDSIEKLQLGAYIKIMGAVDFYTELVPRLKHDVDLFVMLHRQPDPSCTYLETLSCGVPIVSYENMAFCGIMRHADIGWGAATNNFVGIADVIEQLDRDRKSIADKSRNSVAFARKNDFETTFQNRIIHLKKVLKKNMSGDCDV